MKWYMEILIVSHNHIRNSIQEPLYSTVLDMKFTMLMCRQCAKIDLQTFWGMDTLFVLQAL